MDNTPRSELFNDVYFSAEDGIGETFHVFFDGNNLPARWQGRQRFVIGETGFGTGLNFLLAWQLFDQTADEGAFLDFVSVEKYPFSGAEIAQKLAPWADRLEPYLSKLLAQYPIRVPGFHRIVFDNRVALTLIFDDANEALSEIEGNIDAWFLDGFTPSKNPDMWTDKVFVEMARLSHNETTFATFTAAGFVKRGLQGAGFTVAKKKGFGPKRDMLAGHFADGRSRADKKTIHDIPVFGAGLAGTAAAYVLKQYGFNPVLYDPNGIASGASGNPVGIINPRFTAFRTPESDFYTAAFAQTVRTLPQLDCDYFKCGSLHLVTDEEKQKRLSRTVENWQWHFDHMRYLSPQETSLQTGVDVKQEALFLPDSAQVNPSKLCTVYAQNISFKKEKGDISSSSAVLANAAGVLDYIPSLPVHTVRGQITFVKATDQSANVKTNLCYGGYMSAPFNGLHTVGSTFQKWLETTEAIDEDDQSNLSNLADNTSLYGFEITGHRAALRTASTDRFPIIGDMDGMLVTAAHGSHGIASTLMGAHVLADYLRGGPFCLGKSTLNVLSPQRFEMREIRKSNKNA